MTSFPSPRSCGGAARPWRLRRAHQRLLRAHRRPQKRTEAGALSLELAILAPVVMLLLFTIVQAGFYYYARDAALTAAQQGVETARLRGATLADGETQTWDLLSRTGGSITGPAVTGSDSGQLVTITVTGQVPCWLPGVSFTVSQTATAAKEQPGP
ncbi:TadE/TadG family type IV pilus assembly protein [Streptacidiphilus rugosus]|uniref:TadE/TadG family type IV pilus assembly protein n=1 Tax=Streptacidiphilus rugosus TaxID=405783 RepID=UPI00069040B6|nr:TadE/TadG family type IV pilus assembly protein [Streptacidiphilus rugosus]